MKLATTTGDFYAYTQSQALSLSHIREAGFRYADYAFSCDRRGRTGVFSENYREHIAEISDTLDRLGMRLCQGHAPADKPLGEGSELLMADTVRCVEACAAWGIPNLVVHTGYAKGLTKEECFERNKEFFTPILAAAEKHGVCILAENFNKMCREGVYWIDNATDLLSFVEFVDHPLLQAVWDTGHANLQEMPQAEELCLLGKHVRALHVQDNMGQKDSHSLPFCGTLHLDDLMSGLAAIGYDGYFTFEVRNVFSSDATRHPFSGEARLHPAPLSLRLAAERYLYELGKCVLEAYGCFEA